MHRKTLVLITLSVTFLVGACTDESSPTSAFATTTTAVETTTTLRNPYLDVVEVASNFNPKDTVDVVGIAFDERTWIRTFPSDDRSLSGLVWEFDRLQAALVATGIAVTFENGPAWERFDRDELIGFLPQANTGVIGEPEDITSQTTGLEAGSADELLALVAETIAGAEGLDPIQITRREFGGCEVYYDLIGEVDSAGRGYRLRVVVEEIGGGGFGVFLVERSIICVSAVTEEGCV